MEEERHDLGAIPGGGEEMKGKQKVEVELGQAAGTGVGAKKTPANSNACCICHEPWSSCGAHRICCIPCGHVYGRSCLETWLIRSGCRAYKCLSCEKRFKREDIINLYGTAEHIWDSHHHDQAASQGAAGHEEATRQVSKAVMDALKAETTRKRVGIALEREKTDWQRAAQEDVEIARREMARWIQEEGRWILFRLLIFIVSFIVARVLAVYGYPLM